MFALRNNFLFTIIVLMICLEAKKKLKFGIVQKGNFLDNTETIEHIPELDRLRNAIEDTERSIRNVSNPSNSESLKELFNLVSYNVILDIEEACLEVYEWRGCRTLTNKMIQRHSLITHNLLRQNFEYMTSVLKLLILEDKDYKGFYGYLEEQQIIQKSFQKNRSYNLKFQDWFIRHQLYFVKFI